MVNERAEEQEQERSNEQRLDDLLQFSTDITAWAQTTPLNAQDAKMTKDATIYVLGIIGVAAEGMTAEFRAAHPSIPWKDVIAMEEFVGKPDRLLNQTAVEKALHETVPVLLRELTNLRKKGGA